MWTIVDVQELVSLRVNEAWERDWFQEDVKSPLSIRFNQLSGVTTCNVEELILLRKLETVAVDDQIRKILAQLKEVRNGFQA
jgi:hypothetical protein